MKKLMLIVFLTVCPLLLLSAQKVVIITFKADKIKSGDVLIFDKFFREEVQEQLDLLNKKINAENRRIKSRDLLIDEIPKYSLVPTEPRYNEDRNQRILAARQVKAEYMITGIMSIVGNSYIIDTELVRVRSGELVKRNRRLVAGLGELTAASGLIAGALFDEGDVILAEYVDLQDEILAEAGRGDVRDTGEVLTDQGVAFKGVFSVVGGLPDVVKKEKRPGKFTLGRLFPRIAVDSLYTLSTALSGVDQQFYIYSHIRFDNYYLSLNPTGLYEDYLYAKEWSDGLFWGFLASYWPSLAMVQVNNLFGSSTGYSKSAKLLMTIGSGLDMAGDLMFLYSSNYGLEARNRNFEALSGDAGYSGDPLRAFEDNRAMMDVLYFSGLGMKAAGLTVRILGELKPPEGERGFWNKGVYLLGSAASVAGTAFCWMLFKKHEQASQSYIDYIHAPVPSNSDYEEYTKFYTEDYKTMLIVTTGVIVLGGVLKGLSYYLPGPNSRQKDIEAPVALDIGGNGGSIYARLSW